MLLGSCQCSSEIVRGSSSVKSGSIAHLTSRRHTSMRCAFSQPQTSPSPTTTRLENLETTIISSILFILLEKFKGIELYEVDVALIVVGWWLILIVIVDRVADSGLAPSRPGERCPPTTPLSRPAFASRNNSFSLELLLR